MAILRQESIGKMSENMDYETESFHSGFQKPDGEVSVEEKRQTRAPVPQYIPPNQRKEGGETNQQEDEAGQESSQNEEEQPAQRGRRLPRGWLNSPATRFRVTPGQYRHTYGQQQGQRYIVPQRRFLRCPCSQTPRDQVKTREKLLKLTQIKRVKEDNRKTLVWKHCKIGRLEMN